MAMSVSDSDVFSVETHLQRKKCEASSAAHLSLYVANADNVYMHLSIQFAQRHQES